MNFVWKIIFMGALALTGSQVFAQRGELEEVERSKCLLFPKILSLEEQKNGVHYQIAREVDECRWEWTGNNSKKEVCDWQIIIKFNYRYFTVRVLDVYDRNGKLVTIRTEKTALTMSAITTSSDVGKWDYSNSTMTPADERSQNLLLAGFEKSKIQLEDDIGREIFSSNNEICEGSFYK